MFDVRNHLLLSPSICFRDDAFVYSYYQSFSHSLLLFLDAVTCLYVFLPYSYFMLESPCFLVVLTFSAILLSLNVPYIYFNMPLGCFLTSFCRCVPFVKLSVVFHLSHRLSSCWALHCKADSVLCRSKAEHHGSSSMYLLESAYIHI